MVAHPAAPMGAEHHVGSRCARGTAIQNADAQKTYPGRQCCGDSSRRHAARSNKGILGAGGKCTNREPRRSRAHPPYNWRTRGKCCGVTKNISVWNDGKEGQGKALPATALHPKVFCALIISETWKFLYGKYPGSRNPKAAAAANAYWRASGGSTKGWGRTRLSGWRPHFEKVESAAAEKMRNEVRRHCVEHTRSESMS